MLQLAGGATVRASFEVVELGDRAVGAIVRLAEPDRGSATPTRAKRAPLDAGGVTARLVAEVRGALAAGEAALVDGPTGSGKYTVARLALGDEDPAVFDAGRAVVDGARSWLTDVEAALADGRAVIIRHLDVLAADAAGGLAAVLDAAPASAKVVATSAEGTAQALADRFGYLARVPSLGDRVDELPGLVRSMIGRLVPTGAVRVAPEVVQALGRVDLPGNLRQLESLLHRVAVRRRAGTITLDDLPPEVRAATHRPHLTTMEQHECEAIAKALADADGNKAAAASALGISRSTLYRKLDAYGLQLDRRTW